MWWNLAAGLLLLLLLFPSPGRAQGLRSNTASVSLVVVKRDPANEVVRDFSVAPTWVGSPISVAVRLVEGADPLPLFVRDRSGRLVRVSNAFVEVHDSTLRFRAVAPEGRTLGTAAWQLEVRTIDAAGREVRTTTRLGSR